MVRQGLDFMGAKLAALGAILRRMYESVVAERIPDTLAELIDRLDEEERNRDK